MGRRQAPILFTGLLLTLVACGRDPEVGTPDDPGPSPGSEAAQLGPDSIVLSGAGGDPVRLPAPVQRVVSLVPSATETLALLGAAPRLVGRTDYDTARVVAHLPSVGGGLEPNLEILRTLDPDVVVAFAGESDVRTGRVLEQFGIPVLQIRPSGIEDVRTMVEQLGILVGAEDRARTLVEDIDHDLADVAAAVAGRPAVRFAYLLGGTPPLAAGPGTFLSQLAQLAGGWNVLDDLDALYGPVAPEVLVDRTVDVILMTGGSRVDPRILRGRRSAELPGWVEIPGPSLGRAAWEVARALHPDLGVREP